jgi:HEAT repeat protein
MEPILVMAQEPFQMKWPKQPELHEQFDNWPPEVHPSVVFDPASTVSATYGVAFQTQFREGPWSSRPTSMVIDREGVIRYIGSANAHKDLREEHLFPIIDNLAEERRMIAELGKSNAELQQAVQLVLAPQGARTTAAIPALVRALKVEDAQTRVAAATALMWMAPKTESALSELTAALSDADPRVQQAAIKTLKHLAAPASVPALIRRLINDKDPIRTGAMETLERIGPAGIQGLRDGLKDPNVEVRKAVAKMLRHYEEQADFVIPLLSEAIKDADVAVRLTAVSSIEGLALPAEAKQTLVPALLLTLKESHAGIRAASTDALQSIGPHARQAVPALIVALKDDSFHVRNGALNALGQIGGPESKAALPLVIALIKDPQPRVRESAIAMIWRLDPDENETRTIVPLLLEALQDPQQGGHRPAIETLGRLKHLKMNVGLVLPALVQSLKDTNPDVREGAGAAIGGLGEAARDATPALLDAAKDKEAGVRWRAMEALSRIGGNPRTLVPVFMAGLQEPHPHMRRTAVTALGELGPAAKEAVPALTVRLKDEHHRVRREAAIALRKITMQP